MFRKGPTGLFLGTPWKILAVRLEQLIGLAGQLFITYQHRSREGPEEGTMISHAGKLSTRCLRWSLPVQVDQTSSRQIQTWDNWLVVWNMFLFSHILGIIIPIDWYFSEGWLNHQPDTDGNLDGVLPALWGRWCQPVHGPDQPRKRGQ